MPQRSVWFTEENISWLEKHRGNIKFGTLLNILIRHSREAAPDTYLQTLIRDYRLEEDPVIAIEPPKFS